MHHRVERPYARRRLGIGAGQRRIGVAQPRADQGFASAGLDRRPHGELELIFARYALGSVLGAKFA